MSTPFKMKGFSGFGNSPIKQVSGKDYPYHAKFNPKGTSKITDIAKDPIHKEINRIAKGGKPKAHQQLFKKIAKKTTKKGISKTILKGLGRFAAPVGMILGAYDILKGYRELGKTKEGKEIIKGGRPMPGKIQYYGI